LKLTAVAPVKALPVTITVVPRGPLVGEKLVIFGLTLKLVVLVPVPPGVVTAIGPVVAPLGTLVAMDVSFVTEKLAPIPPNVTDVAPVKPDPVKVTVVPTMPLGGVKLVTTGEAAKATVGASPATTAIKSAIGSSIRRRVLCGRLMLILLAEDDAFSLSGRASLRPAVCARDNVPAMVQLS
jgi:hypothetical protein